MFRWTRKVILVGLAILFLYQVFILVHILFWSWFNPVTTAFIAKYSRELAHVESMETKRQVWLEYADISDHLKKAVVAAEDSSFVSHNGFDWNAISYAIRANFKARGLVLGGSTITQQLAKNLFLNSERSFLRKGQEAIITLMIEITMSKERILEIYLNVIEWGNGIYGAEAAAQHYFRIGASDLNSDQAAELAAIIPNPKYYDKVGTTSVIESKVPKILYRMRLVRIP